MSVSKTKQWKEWIASMELAGWFRMTKNMADIIRKHQCMWLGHLARMDSGRLPKQLLLDMVLKDVEEI